MPGYVVLVHGHIILAFLLFPDILSNIQEALLLLTNCMLTVNTYGKNTIEWDKRTVFEKQRNVSLMSGNI